MTSQSGRYKLTFQLTAHGSLLEVRAQTLGGQGRAQTSLPPQRLLDLLSPHDPANIPSATLRQVGQALHGCLVADQVGELVAEVFQDARQDRHPVHFELRFDPDQTSLAQYPWEMITDELDRPLVRDGLVDLTRYISYPQPPPVLDAAFASLPILQVISQPATLRPVAPAELTIQRIERLVHATFEQLQHRLLIERLALWGLHFDGHGALVLQCHRCDAICRLDTPACRRCGTSLSEAKQVGVLAFERDDDVEWISTEALGSVLYNAQVSLALLLACETARVGNRLIFSGLAPGLILAGVPAVVGMQYPVIDQFSQNFANAFYARLLHSNDVLDAMRTARSMTARESWYSPVLYLRCRPTPEAEERAGPGYSTRSIDTAAPEEAREGVDFLVRLWIRRPETEPLTQEQLRKELGILTPAPVSTREVQAEVKFEPIEGRKLRRGELEVECKSPACDVHPDRIKLFVDEHLDAPPAIFACRARTVGRTVLYFSVWQDGGEIASVAHRLQVIEERRQPRANLRSESHTVPVEDTTPTLGLPVDKECSLVVQTGSRAGSEIPLTQSAMTIGRASTCALTLQDPGLSRRHAELHRQEQGWVIADLGSTNGTFVNGIRLSTPRRLEPGDEIRLGDLVLRLVEHGPSPTPSIPMAWPADVTAYDVAPAPPPAPRGADQPRPARRARRPGPGKASLATLLSVLLAVAVGAAALSIGIVQVDRTGSVTPASVVGLPIYDLVYSTSTASATLEMLAPASTPGPIAMPTPEGPSWAYGELEESLPGATPEEAEALAPAPSLPVAPVSWPSDSLLWVVAGLLWVVILAMLAILILLIRGQRRR